MFFFVCCFFTTKQNVFVLRTVQGYRDGTNPCHRPCQGEILSVGLTSLLNNEKVSVMQSTNPKSQKKGLRQRQAELTDYPGDGN